MERERFLHESCTDPALRDGLIALIKKHSRSTPAPSGPETSHETAGLATGTLVGPYVVVDRLGRGGMGEVFLAKDPRLDRLVALKCVLSRDIAGDDLRTRIIHEARAAARITHPGIAGVYDVVEHDGRTFIVMEYVPGESLAAVLRREPVSITRVVEIGQALAEALAAAHRAGIIHRDLKPANVQVMTDGSVKILDFGIAMAVASATTRTDPGAPLPVQGMNQGTPPYMSPEQLLGLNVDHRTDLFSLAVVLFEMATGRRPFDSLDPLDVLLASVRRAPRADRVDPRVPAALAETIDLGLSADPALRYQTAAEFAAALQRVRHELAPGEDRAADTIRPQPVSLRVIAATLSAGILIVLWCLGWIMTVAYNNTLGREGGFASEPARAYFVWSARSLVAPFVYATLTMAALWAGRFLVQLAALSRSAATAERRIASAWKSLSVRLSLDDVLVFEPGLMTLGIAALALVAWQFNDLILAWGSNISTASSGQLARLGPEYENEKVMYRAVLTVLLLLFSGGLAHAVRLRSRRPTGRWGSFAACMAIVASILLLNEVPYRILWKNQAPRISYDGSRCYVIGASGSDSLIFCPDLPPPRNKIVRSSDPRIHPSGVTESIFSAAAHAR